MGETLIKKHGIMVKVLDSGLEISDFKIQSYYYVYFQTNTLGKYLKPLISPAIITVLQQEWLWH